MRLHKRHRECREINSMRVIIYSRSCCSAAPPAQQAQTPKTTASLPDAPQMRLMALAGQSDAPMQPNAGNQTPAQPAGSLPSLSRTQAEQTAIKNNPRISVARLLALAQHQVVRESRAAELPTVTGSHHRSGRRRWLAPLCRNHHCVAPLRTRRRRRQRHPADHRFWTNQKSDCFLEAPGKGSEREHSGHHGGHCCCHRSGILRRTASPGAAACGPAECRYQADHPNPSQPDDEEQSQVHPRSKLRGCQPLAVQIVASRCPEQSRFHHGGPGRGAWVWIDRLFINWRTKRRPCSRRLRTSKD